MRLRTRRWAIELRVFGWEVAIGVADASKFRHVGILWEPLTVGICTWFGIGRLVMVFVSWWQLDEYERFLS